MNNLWPAIRSITEPECKRIADRVVRDLRRMSGGMQCRDNSGLATVWDQVCVQVQDRESAMWDLYLDIMSEMIETQVRLLSVELKKPSGSGLTTD